MTLKKRYTVDLSRPVLIARVLDDLPQSLFEPPYTRELLYGLVGKFEIGGYKACFGWRVLPSTRRQSRDMDKEAPSLEEMLCLYRDAYVGDWHVWPYFNRIVRTCTPVPDYEGYHFGISGYSLDVAKNNRRIISVTPQLDVLAKPKLGMIDFHIEKNQV